MSSFPEGKFMATLKIGPKGQIVIPSEVRKMFRMEAGDTVLLLADKERGIAIRAFPDAEPIWRKITGEDQ